jgi:hypothetical protein
MLSPVQKEKYRERFSAIESNFRIEGMDPSEDAIYRSAKEAVLAGSMTPKQALAYVIDQTAQVLCRPRF